MLTKTTTNKMLWLDRETFCELDLKEVGTYRYADEAEDLLVAYAIDDNEPRVWDATAEELHDELYYAMEDEDREVTAHNAQFDKAIHNGPKQLRLPRIALPRWRCSMAQALSHALPGGLSDLGSVLGLSTDLSKDKDGKKLIQKFTRPHYRTAKGVTKRTVYNRHTHPEEWERFKLYAAQDITAMRECVRRMPRWNWDDSAIAEWHCDQRINERGFYVDTELTKAGIRASEAEKQRITQRVAELTGGTVRVSQRAQFQGLLNERFGLDLDNTRADTFIQLIKESRDTLPAIAVELMELAMAANKTSTAKYAALDPAVQADGRFRGGAQFAGASRTRRWAGRLFQFQNLPARGLPPSELVDWFIYTLKDGTDDLWF